MKQIALIALVITLLISLFSSQTGSELSSNTVAIALMILLLVLFSELGEFNFWGISGKKKDPDIKKLNKAKVISADTADRPSTYKLNKAQTEDVPDNNENISENILALSFEIERQLRVLLRGLSHGKIEGDLSPTTVLNELRDQKLLTAQAVTAIKTIREVKNLLVHGRGNELTEKTLAESYELARNIYEQLKNWLNKVS